MRLWPAFLIFLTLQAFGGPVKPHPTNISFAPSAVSDSLSQITVTQSFQDAQGALWFVTQEGINKYTGKTVEQFLPSQRHESSLSSSNVSRITEDRYGTIWIATIGGGLIKYNSNLNGFQHFKFDTADQNSPISNDITAVFADRKGDIWLGYKNGF